MVGKGSCLRRREVVLKWSGSSVSSFSQWLVNIAGGRQLQTLTKENCAKSMDECIGSIESHLFRFLAPVETRSRSLIPK